MATHDGVLNVFAALAQGGCRPPPAFSPEKALPVWLAVLQDVDDGEIQASCVVYLRSREPWWPTPGVLMALRPGRDQGIDDADCAWGELQALVRKHGSYRPPWTSEGPAPSPEHWVLHRDPRRRVAMEEGLRALGGWSKHCASLIDQEPACRASFRAAYRSAWQRGRSATEWQSVGQLLDMNTRRRLQ